MISILLLLLALPLAAASPAEELLLADRAFDRAAAASGLDGWMSYFAADSIANVPGGPLRGQQAIRAYYAKMFARKNFSIRWKPFHAEASKDGSFGYTLGTAVISWTGDSGAQVKQEGRYLTVWRKQPGGQWRVVSDMGN